MASTQLNSKGNRRGIYSRMLLCGDGKQRLIDSPKSLEDVRRLIEDRSIKVIRKLPTECWEWCGSRVGGYSSIRYGGKPRKGSRLSWLAHKGDIPDGIEVCHKCDNPPCVNPDHLYLGTHKQNLIDAGKNGLMGKSRGESHYCSSFKVSEIRALRHLFSVGLRPTAILAGFFSVSYAALKKIHSGQSWKSVTA